MKRIFPSVAVVVFLIVLTGCGKVVVGVNHALPPPVVFVAQATRAETLTSIEAVATLEGASSREIHSPVPGYLIKQAYQEGALVQAGGLLFEIDTNPEHMQPGATTAYTKITSPITGVAARAEHGLGDLINPTMTLTTISSVDEIAAQFSLPQSHFEEHAALFASIVAMPMDQRPENVQLILDDGSVYPKMGRLSFFHRVSPTSTGNGATAVFPNPDHLLKPGQYARVRVSIDTDTNFVLIPGQSIARLQDADHVMVVKPDNTVEIRKVTLGGTSGNSWIITDGLTVGESVVVDSNHGCVPGETVTPQPYTKPATNAPPQ